MGRPDCQRVLVKQYAPRLLAICKRYSSNTESANDALQETFINVFKYINGFSGQGSFEGWLKRIAVNCSITFGKKFNKFHFHDEAEIDRSKNFQLPNIYGQMNKEDILQLLDQLPKSLYTVFNLAIIEGYNHKEIGEVLGISESTSRASLSRARNKLIEIIENENRQEASAMSRLTFVHKPAI